MSQNTVSAIQQQVNMPAVDLRQALMAIVSAEGVRTSSDLVVAQRGAGANMSVDVAAGTALVADDHGSGGGFYAVTSAGTVNLAVSASDPSNPRIDRIVFQIDDAYLGDSDNTFALKVIKGTATSGATLVNLTGAAAVPGSTLLLANVLIPAGASSIVTADIANVANSVAVGGGTTVQFNTQTANYTFVLGDASKLVEMNVAGANTLTVPPNSSVAFPVGTVITVAQYGAGQTTLTAGAGVTIRANPGLKLVGQYAVASLIKRATDEWYAAGQLST